MEMKKFLVPPYPLTKFETHKYHQNENRLNRVYSRGNFPKKQRMGHK